MSRHRASYPYPPHPVRRAAGRGLLRLAWCAALIGAAALLAPVTVVAAAAFWYGWWRGAPPRRIGVAALWSLPMTAAWLIAVAAWPPRAAGGLRAGGAAYPAGVGPGSWWF